MNKGLLVARHEYVEMVRTKTFWLGLLAFPVIILLVAAIPILLEGTREARTYAVLDHSGFLMHEVEQITFEKDLTILLDVGRERRKRVDGGRGFEELPETVQQLTLAWMELDAEQRGDFVRQVVGTGERAELGLPSPPTRAAKFLSSGSPRELLTWWSEADSDELESLGLELSRSRFARTATPAGDPQEVMAELNAMLGRDDLFAYFVIGPDPTTSSEGCKYVSKNLTDRDLTNWFVGVATEVVRKRRIAAEQIDLSVAAWIQRDLEFEGRKLASTGVEEEVGTVDRARQWAPVAFTYLLWFAIFTSAQMLLTSTIEEKSARIIEVLLASVSPLQLMVGKLIGVAGAGLTVVASWALWLFLGLLVLPTLTGVPSLGFLGEVAGDPMLLLAFVSYFVLGYMLYAAFLVGVGSVCSNLKDAQNLMLPVMIPMIIAISSMVPIGKDPNGLFAQVMSFIPPFTPFVMMNRSAGPPALWEYVATTLVLLGAIYVVSYGAAKIFRIGILMTGKPPTIREVLRWLTIGSGTIPAAADDGT